MDHRRALELFERRRDAWLDEDLDAYLAFFAADLVFQGPAGPPLVGKAEYSDLVERSLEAVRPVSFEVHDVAVHERNVLAEWTQSVEVRSSGTVLVWRGMSICEIRDDLIAWWREYYDPAQLRPPGISEDHGPGER